MLMNLYQMKQQGMEKFVCLLYELPTCPYTADMIFITFFSLIVPVFQVVRFPNDACAISGGAKNGTCYTA